MGAPGFVRFLSVTAIALFIFPAGDAFAQWTYRISTDPYIRNISVFAGNPAPGTNTLIVSTLTDGMYKVIDTGNSATSSFTKISNGLPTLQVRTHSAIDLTTIYAGTDGAGLFKTTDGGANWLPLNGSGATALGCSNVRTINTDVPVMPATARILTVGTSCRNNSGFYRSTDDGLTWSRLNDASLPDDVGVSSLIRSASTYVLASSNYGIFRSINAGVTWSPTNTGITSPSGVINAFNVQFNATGNASMLAYIHGSGMYRSIDAGVTWLPSNVGLPAGFAALGGIARESNLVFYVGLDKEGVYRTLDGGATWALWANPAANDRVPYTRTVATVTAGSTYYFGTLDGLAKTTNNAASVNGMEFGNGGGRINSITHDRDVPYRAYVTGATVYRLDYFYGDCSAGCAELDNGLTGTTIEGVVYQDQTTPATLYVTTGNKGIFKSTNAGASFSPINNGLPASMIGQSSRLAIDANSPQTLYLGLSDAAGMYKSVDGGANWVAINSGLDTPMKRSINTVTIDPNNSTIVYAATDAGLYKSIDSGASWTLKYSALDSGGSLLPVGAIRVRTGNSLELYMANYHANANGSLAPSSGVHKSSDGGNTWTNVLPNQGASQVRVLVNGDVYAGISNTTGNPAVWLSTNGGASFTPYSGGLNGSDIRSFGVSADVSALLSLSLENGLYTHNTGGPPPSVPLTARIAEAPGLFTKVFFGYQLVGTTSVSKAVTVTNNSLSPATIVGFGIDNDSFSVQSHNCPSSLAAGATCTVNITFTPNFPGLTSDVLVAAGPVSGIAVDVSGIGVPAGQPVVVVAHDPGMVPAYADFYTPGPTFREITFGNQAVNTSRTISVTLRNFGTVPAPFSYVVPAPFSATNGCTFSVPAGGSCVLNVTYLPTTTPLNDNQTLTLTVPGNAFTGSFGILLYGIPENPAIDGSLVPTFGSAGKAFVSFGPYGVETGDRLVTQTDGKILVLMSARKAVEDGNPAPGIARLNVDGTLDTTWGTAGYLRLAPAGLTNSYLGNSGLYVRPDGTVIVAFGSGNASSSANLEVFRLQSNGQIDTTFGTGGSTTIANLTFNRLDIYPDGRMLAIGNADTININKLGLVRLNASGTLDASFGTAGRVELLLPEVMQLAGTQGTLRTALASDEKIFVAYSFGAGSARDIAIYKLTTAGTIDTTWGTAGRVNVAATSREDNVRHMRVQLDGKILLLSRTARIAGGGNYESVMTRLNADGSVDSTFGTAGVVTTTILSTTNLPTQLLITVDGKILVAGSRSCGGSCLSGRDGYIARYNSDGSLDGSFGTAGIKEIVIAANFDAINVMTIAADGSIVAAGQVTQNDMDRGNTIDNAFVVRMKNTIGPALVNLTVNLAGSGSVTSSPAGINCGNVCVASFAPGAMVTLTAATSGGSTFAGWSGGGCSGTGTCTVSIAAAVTVTATFTGGVANLVSVLSRKLHGGVDTYELPVTIGVPINGAITVEPRMIGAGHKIVFQFDQAITTLGGVSATIGMASAVATGSNDVVVTLTGVPDNQRATISLAALNGNVSANASVSMGFLVGDMNGTQRVGASDISAVKARASASLTLQNFMYDLNVSGAINSQDTSMVKARSGLVMP